MPVYEYYCEHCDVEYEIIRTVSRMDEPAPCATCSNNGKRQLSHFSFKSKTFSAPKLGLQSKAPFRAHNRDVTPSSGDDGTVG